MTRAQSQVVAWWSPAFDEPNGGLSRLLRGREPGESTVPDRCVPAKISDDDAMTRLQKWEAAGGPVIEESVVAPPAAVADDAEVVEFSARHFHRAIDTTWRRTSYSGLIRAAETTGVSSEPEIVELDDEVAEIPSGGEGFRAGRAVSDGGSADGRQVRDVGTRGIGDGRPVRGDLAAELESQIREHSVWWPVNVDPSELAAAMVPLHDTPLGPLAGGVTLRAIGSPDRLREMDFELPLAGGDLRAAAPDIRLADVGVLLREHLPSDDVLASYADRLTGDALGNQSLRGYLSGSVDAVLRVGGRYLVVDYKTNWLGEGDRPLTSADYDRARMTEAMLHSDYPLQALLYSVVLHRFLRWRQRDYEPSQHLGGVLYLFLRGMCGADTPVVNGQPAGVFSWDPPASLVVALSDLLDAGRAAA